MMSLIKKLKIDLGHPKLISIFGYSNVGKTSAMFVIAAELVNSGYRVLFMSEEPHKNILKKFNNLIYRDKHKVFSNILTIKGVVSSELNLVKMIDSKKYDFIFIDSPTYNYNNLSYIIKDVMVNKKISFFVSHQAMRWVGLKENELGLLDVRNSSQVATLSDLVIGIEHNKNTLSIFWDKIIKFFGIKKKNITFKVLKNCHGKVFDFNYHIDFEKINK